MEVPFTHARDLTNGVPDNDTWDIYVTYVYVNIIVSVFGISCCEPRNLGVKIHNLDLDLILMMDLFLLFVISIVLTHCTYNLGP